jgi:hypothetical protein
MALSASLGKRSRAGLASRNWRFLTAGGRRGEARVFIPCGARLLVGTFHRTIYPPVFFVAGAVAGLVAGGE